MASELLIATRSADKLSEIRGILGSRFKLISLGDMAVAPAEAEEQIESHPTFIENAIAKACYFAQLTGRPTLADDSGLVVDALQGRPGVRTKRFASDEGIVSNDVDLANNELLLRKLENVTDDARGAHYVCAAAFADKDHLHATTLGTCSGVIARAARGAGGFGYDPLFIIPDLAVTFAELTAEQKNQRSHRARAFRAIAPLLR